MEFPSRLGLSVSAAATRLAHSQLLPAPCFAAHAALRRRRLSAPLPMAFIRAACARPFMRSSTTGSMGCRPGWAACWPKPSRNWPAKPLRRCWSCRCRCTLQSTRNADSTVALARPRRAQVSAQEPSRVAAHAGFEHPPAATRTETQAGLNPHERRRNVRAHSRSRIPYAWRRRTFSSSTTFDHGSHGARRGPGAGRGRRRIRLGGHAGARAARRKIFDTEEEAPLSGALPEAESQAARSSTNGAAMPAF